MRVIYELHYHGYASKQWRWLRFPDPVTKRKRYTVGLLMLHSLAALNLADSPDDGASPPHHQAGRRDERMSLRRRQSSSVVSYLAAMAIAAGLIVAWVGICCI